MAALQATIPFKSRKRTNTNFKKEKLKENEDILNTTDFSTIRKLKRRLKDDLKDIEDDDCTAVKISRNHENEPEIKAEDEVSRKYSAQSLQPLTCREKEIEWIENFLYEHLESGESASLYISGQPGTGKTASLSYVLQLPKIKEGYKQVYVNCTMIKSASSIYQRICKELHIPVSGTSEKACCAAIENYLTKKHKMILVVLDEMDQLESRGQSVLYRVFSWAGGALGGVVLVGAANALALPERLPRLAARTALRPATLHFAPYTKEQIIHVFTSQLATEDQTKLFSPVALQMLAAKIAAVSGDMRRALDIGRRVIELAKRNKFSENQSVEAMMKDATVTVELKQVLEVLSNVYGGSREAGAELDDGLPMQQKLILCSLLLILTKGKNKDMVMGKLYDVYKKVAISRNIAPLDMCEMAGACGLLEARGAVTLGGGGRGGKGGARSRRLHLAWDVATLSSALRDKPLLHAILNDPTCLPTQ